MQRLRMVPCLKRPFILCVKIKGATYQNTNCYWKNWGQETYSFAGEMCVFL